MVRGIEWAPQVVSVEWVGRGGVARALADDGRATVAYEHAAAASDRPHVCSVVAAAEGPVRIVVRRAVGLLGVHGRLRARVG